MTPLGILKGTCTAVGGTVLAAALSLIAALALASLESSRIERKHHG